MRVPDEVKALRESMKKMQSMSVAWLEDEDFKI